MDFNLESSQRQFLHLRNNFLKTIVTFLIYWTVLTVLIEVDNEKLRNMILTIGFTDILSPHCAIVHAALLSPSVIMKILRGIRKLSLMGLTLPCGQM